MAALARAIAATSAYSHFFGKPLTLTELHLWLISPRRVSLATLKTYPLPHLTSKQQSLLKKRAKTSAAKIKKATRLARLIAFLPPVRLVCATGSMAISNARPADDLDLFLVTSPHTLWLTRPLVVFLLKLLRLRRPVLIPEHRSSSVSDKVCDNLWLDETALALPQDKRNLYTAHEVLQAKPLVDKDDTYTCFLQANAWTKKYLANAYPPLHPRGSVAPAAHPGGVLFSLTRTLNSLAFKLQYAYMKKKITRETITLHAAFFHPHDPAAALNRLRLAIY